LERLAARARHGDPAALDAVLRGIRPDILRRCGRILAHSHDAEEACQDALLAIATNITGFEGRCAFRTWASTVAANAARQTYRKLRQRSAEQPADEFPTVADRRTTSMIAATKLDLLDALDQLERDQPDLVEPLVLRELAQLDYANIAERLGLHIGTVRTRIHRGRLRLRDLLTDRTI
jgi:RNA polymerase sigma-70 factor (ECF subfamily)